MARLTVIGGGFMGSAIVEGLIDSGWPPAEIIVAEVREARRQHLVDHLKVTVTDDATAAVRQSPTVIFAVKPQDVETTVRGIRGVYALDTLAVSVCAGIPIALYESMLGEVPVIRCMPNTPAAIGLSATAIARGRYATDQNLATALNILATVGKVVVVDEDQMDAVTAVSGTGPAYVFYLAEAMIRAAEEEGLTTEQAYLLVYQTMHGAARLLRHDPAGPAELRRRVTSPGGTTHAAITYLENAEWERTFREAVHEARKRSEELGRP
jgi:pyrroline-5-carboxylate reductase